LSNLAYCFAEALGNNGIPLALVCLTTIR
jgi:hypothetical protein